MRGSQNASRFAAVFVAAAVVTQGLAWAQDPADQAERIRAAMAASLELQRDAVRKQETAVRATPAGMHMTAASTMTMMAPPPMANCDPVPQPELTRMIGEASRKAGVDGSLVREVARQESAFRPCAISPKGAQGLMQLMPATQSQLAVANPFDPQESLEAGSKLLKQLLDRYHGDLSLALSAYNAGANCVDQSGGVPNIQETRSYVATILSRLTGFDDAAALTSIPGIPPLATPLGASQFGSSQASGCQSAAASKNVQPSISEPNVSQPNGGQSKDDQQ